jgi:hypothetical protein
VEPVQPGISAIEMNKMERCILYDLMHESILSPNKEILMMDCTSESPNAFWHREKYFVSLPYNPLVSVSPQKAYAALMSPS